MLGDLGVDLGHTGYRASLDRAQTIFVDLIDAQAREARDNGLRLQEVTPGPHVTESPDRAAARGGREPSQRPGARQARDGRRLAQPVLRRLPLLLGVRRHQGRDDQPRGGVPRAGEARGDRPVRPGAGHRRHQGDAGRPQRGRRRAAGDAVLRRQPRARVDRGRGRAAHADLVARARRRPADRGAAQAQRAVVPADPESRRLRLHVHLRHRLPDRGQRDVRRHAGDRSGQPAARHVRLQDARRHHPGAQRRTAGPGAAQADQPAVAQDRSRQRRQRRLWRRPGRRRPEPQLPDGVGPGRGGLELPARRAADLPRAEPALGAGGPRVRPAAAQDHARGGHQLPLGGAAAAVPVRLHHRRLRRRRPVVQGADRHRRRRRGRPVHLAAVVGPLHHQRRDDRPRVQQVQRRWRGRPSSTSARRPPAARSAAAAPASRSPTTRARSRRSSRRTSTSRATSR